MGSKADKKLFAKPDDAAAVTITPMLLPQKNPSPVVRHITPSVLQGLWLQGLHL